MNPPDWLRGLDRERPAMLALLEAWAAIGSGSRHTPGLQAMAAELERAFTPLADQAQRIACPPELGVSDTGEPTQGPIGPILLFHKRPRAARRVLLGIHYDTVYGPEHPFSAVTHEPTGWVRGPGVADAKGGLVVLLHALRAFELSPHAHELGWTVFLNADEEIGSPGSGDTLRSLAQGYDLGMLYEPALPDGSLVSARGGSGMFTLVVRGRSAHVGRDPAQGRNAIHHLAAMILRLTELPGACADPDSPSPLIVNVGRVLGGHVVNMVPDLAIARFNVRAPTPAAQRAVELALAELSSRPCPEGIRVELHGGFHAPPKPLDEPTQSILDTLRGIAPEAGVADLRWRATAGVSDGNKLAAAGLPTVDNLGVVGADLHSEREAMDPDSLISRARLSALLLDRYARGEFPRPARCPHAQPVQARSPSPA